MNAPTGLLIGNRYQLLNKLGEGGMGAVYRAMDRLTRQIVALKRVVTSKPDAEPPTDLNSSSDTKLILAHEFQTLASLHHPHVINVLDYGFDSEQQPYFTMSLLETPRTIIEAGKDRPVHGKVELLMQTLQALAYLHQRGIIHRDLKPDNALVTADGEVRVLDFGLAVLHENRPAEDILAGTLTYMAPEVIQGMAAVPASDFYAIGVMAFELLTGRHPFDTKDINNLLRATLFEPADVKPVSEVNEYLGEIVERLLAKTPESRFETAYDIITQLSHAIDQPMPQETSAIRESFLQAAQFVGRETEFKQLTQALAEAKEGHGSAWLIGGESGVGKSRLLDEVRVRALVSGSLVLHGQGIAEGGLPYQFWRSPLRRLVLAGDLSDLDASVLKQVIPDIGELLERQIPDASELDGQAGGQRLLQAILGLFRRQTQPIVLILEDVQWAVESLDILKPLIPLTQDLPLLIVANYRDDEKPDLPDDLPDMHVIKLERLSQAAIAQLSASMLGESGERKDVVDLLSKETEGNVFFVIEVVRALAEEAGRLADIGRMTLPKYVFAGGMKQVVQRRLNQVPEYARGLLNLAAVAGRQLDLALLALLDSTINLDDWLLHCSNVAVLDVMDEQWRFAHDKLREGLLGAIDADERKRLHHQIAEALQQVHSHELDEYASTIGDHYEHAGEMVSSATWYERAGAYARSIYAPDVAIGHFRKALTYWLKEGQDSAEADERRLHIYEGLSNMLNWQARYDEAIEFFGEMRELAEQAGDKMAQVQAWLGMSTAQIYQGDFHGATESAGHVETLAREADMPLKLAQALFVKGWNAFRTGDIDGALAIGDQVMAICEQIGHKSQMAQCLNLMGAIHYTVGQYDKAGEAFAKASDILQELGDRGQAMALVNNVGAIADARGDYQMAFERYQEALKISREIGIRDAEMLYLSNLGGACAHLGDYDTAEKHLQQVIHMAEAIPFGQISETYRLLAETYLGKNKSEAALDAGKRALTLGIEVDLQEAVAAAWRVLGQTAAYSMMPIIMGDGDDAKVYMPEACFAESVRICEETGMEGERARTLKAWARYLIGRGEAEKGRAMWQEARDLFRQLGAELEAERMES